MLYYMCWCFASWPSDWLKQPAEHLSGPETGKSEVEITQHQHMYNLWLDLSTQRSVSTGSRSTCEKPTLEVY